MEKVAIVELNANDIKLHFVDVVKNKNYVIYDTKTMPINLFKDYNEDSFIKPAVIKEVLDILCVFKSMINEEQVVETLCYATSKLAEAKNLNGFTNEMYNASGLKFVVLTPEEEINYIYTSVINTFNKPKGIIVNVNNFNTEIVIYNRRNILNTLTMPFGDISMTNKYAGCDKESFYASIKKEVLEALSDAEWLKEPYEEFDVIGVGNVFKNIGVLARKAIKYPLDMVHNYTLSTDAFKKVYSVISNQDIATGNKIKGIPASDSKSFQAGIAIVDAIVDIINKPTISISNFNYLEGLLFNYSIQLTLEKPIMDVLGYSLQVINEYYNEKRAKVTEKVYNISMILYRQLKVLHKLSNKMYQRVLRIASFMSNCGYRVDLSNSEKAAFNVILSSNIYGVTQTEILLAGFVVMAKNSDNFNLKEWVRYGELLTDEDLKAVQKLSVILRLAEALNITGFGAVDDINCDILGDSVIIKTIVNRDAQFEIKYASQVGNDFKKAFNKHADIL